MDLEAASSTSGFLWLALGAGIIGIIGAVIMAASVLRRDQGSQEIREIGRLIQDGAMAFLKREYALLSIFVIVVTVLLAVFIDFNLLDNQRIAAINAQSSGVAADGPWTAISYLLGAVGSGLAGFIGMSIAVRGNTRTATAAMKGLNPALQVAFRTGTVMGLTVVGIGLLGMTVLWWIFRDPSIVAGFGFGASSIALFARVGGGIYTKAADIGADLVGKVEIGIPEDDPRNPATIADNVGDNVGDVAGMGADLFESYVGAMIAAFALSAAGASFLGLAAPTFDSGLMVLPLAIAGAGILASIIGTFLVRTGQEASLEFSSPTSAPAADSPHPRNRPARGRLSRARAFAGGLLEETLLSKLERGAPPRLRAANLDDRVTLLLDPGSNEGTHLFTRRFGKCVP